VFISCHNSVVNMVIFLRIPALAVFLVLSWGDESTLINKMLREHGQRTVRKTAEMSLETALEVLKKTNDTFPLSEMYPLTRSGLRKNRGINVLQVDKGGIKKDAAQKAYAMVNDMIKEAEGKYSDELARCCSYDKKQSLLIEETRQTIALYNAKAAEAKKLMLEASSGISTCETQLENAKTELTESLKMCESRKREIDMQLVIVRNDSAVITEIVEKSNCDKKPTLVQLNSKIDRLMVYKCSDECGDYETVGTDKPMSPRMQALAIKMVFEPIPMPLGEGFPMNEILPPPKHIPRARPCKAKRTLDPMKAGENCKFDRIPQCGKLLEAMYEVNTELLETQTRLEKNRAILVTECETTQRNLQAQIEKLESDLKHWNMQLAYSTEVNSNSMETSRTKTIELVLLQTNYKETTVECHSNYDDLEAQICALQKLRMDVFTKLSGTKSLLFADCVVSEWTERDPGCSATCGGGSVYMQRTIEQYPFKGAACPELEMVLPCHEEKCAVDCAVGDWSGWSDCTTKCGGGLKTRARPIVRDPMYKGEACGETEQVQGCNQQSCDVDCVLSDWTAWATCSKACDGGHTTRMRTVLQPSVGDGSCPDIDGPTRLNKKPCNTHVCTPIEPNVQFIQCKSKTDVVVLIDGSASVGKEGWEQQKKAAVALIDAINISTEGNDMSIIVYSGPRYLCEYYQCMGWHENTRYFKNNCEEVTPENLDCGVKVVADMTNNSVDLRTNLGSTVWPGRTTFTSKALAKVDSELRLGQKGSNSVVVVMTDGHPADKQATAAAAEKLSKKAKLIWVPITSAAPLERIKGWATDPVENVIPVGKFTDLNERVIEQITATACPEVAVVKKQSSTVDPVGSR